MHQSLKLAAIGLTAAALTACSGAGSSLPGPQSPVSPQSIVRSDSAMLAAGIDPARVHIMRTMDSARPDANPSNLRYFGGPIERRPHIYVIYWGFQKASADPSHEKAYLTAFLTGIGGSPWLNTDSQYYDKVGSSKFNIHNRTGQLAGTWVDASAVPTSPTDAQIQAEAAKGEAHFGYNVDGNYVVATPHLHNSAGFGSTFCAYHSPTTSGGGEISYTNLPYMTDAGGSCGENSVNPGAPGLLDGVSIVAGHEEAESQTDPKVNLNTAWYSNTLGEIGDACAWQNLADITLNGSSFAVQPLWSNKIGACALHTP
jgi:hypothetical protein